MKLWPLLLLPLAACASAAGPDGDIANYDTLKVARAACTAKGGDLILADQGDAQRMSAYVCKRKPAK